MQTDVFALYMNQKIYISPRFVSNLVTTYVMRALCMKYPFILFMSHIADIFITFQNIPTNMKIFHRSCKMSPQILKYLHKRENIATDRPKCTHKSKNILTNLKIFIQIVKNIHTNIKIISCSHRSSKMFPQILKYSHKCENIHTD